MKFVIFSDGIGVYRYKAVVICRVAQDRTLRFNQPQKLIPQATAKMPNQQLRELGSTDSSIARRIRSFRQKRSTPSLTTGARPRLPSI